MKFSGKGTFPNAGGICLGNANDTIDHGGTDTRTNASAASNRVGGSDIGIGTVIQVE